MCYGIKLGLLSLVVGLCSSIATAEVVQSKDWGWDASDSDFAYAATMNANGRVLGQYCYFDSGKCLFLVDVGVACENGDEYPAIVSADKGAFSLSLVCRGELTDGPTILAISKFDDMAKLVRTSVRIGFVVPLEDGQFKVTRFSLAGSTNALNQMRAAARRKANHENEDVGNPDDQYL